jgi:hypothetical protein
VNLLAVLACVLPCVAQLKIAPTGFTITQPGQSVTFVTNAVTDASGKQNVAWSVSPLTGMGTITQTGQYTAPSPLPASGATVQIRVLDFGSFAGGAFATASATVNLAPTAQPTSTCSQCSQYPQILGLALDGTTVTQFPLTINAQLVYQLRVPAPTAPGDCPAYGKLANGATLLDKSLAIYAVANGVYYFCDDDGKWGRIPLQKTW